MKRTALISLISSILAAVVLMIGVLLVMVMDDEEISEKSELVIASASAAAVYNGETLLDDEWYLSQGYLKEGHTLSVSVTGSQKHVGVSENYVTAKVLDGDGADVTEEYNIEYKPGFLNVKEREICLIADSEMKLYDGTPLTSEKYTIESAISLLPTDTIEATVEGSITEIGEEKNRITSAVILNDMGEDVTRNYNIKTIDGKLIVYSSNSLVFESADAVKEYDGTSLTNDNWKLVSGLLAKDHTVQVSVIGSQTAVGDSENIFSVQIFDENGEDVTDTYEIVCKPGTLNVIPAEVTVISDSAQKQYDGKPLSNADFTTDPEYYSALFRFEPVIVGSQTEVGESENTITDCKVYDLDGNDVTNNFVLVYECGVLEVTEEPLVPPKLVFASMEAEKIYDGQPLTNGNWELLEGEFLEGHTPTVTVTGSITDAGMCDNRFTVSIGDFSGNDVTEMYIIEMQYGTLTVHKQPLKITSDSAQKTYDGDPLTASGYKVVEESIAKLYTFDCQIVGSRTEVGTSPNTIANCYVFNSDGVDISENFDIEKEDGVLTVLENEDNIKPELTYQSGSAKKIYDGAPLTSMEWDRTSGELKTGHKEIVAVTGWITCAGRSDNEYTVKIVDENGNDVTDQYVINQNYGTLLVTPKYITITANSVSKNYDGQPLSDNGYTVMNTDPSDMGQFPWSDTLIVNIIGSITEPGEIDNTISSVDVQNSDGQSVKDSYVITTQNGLLRVVGGTEDVKPTGEVLFNITSTKDDVVYLKELSFGNYDPVTKRWSAAPEYGLYIDDTMSAYYLPSFAIDNIGLKPECLDIESLKGIFVMPYYSSAYGSKFVQTSDVMMQGDTNSIYTAYYYSRDSVTGVSLPTKYAAYEDAYAAFVKENYLDVDAQTYAYMQDLIQENGWDPNSADIISIVANYIKKSAEYDLDYNRAMDQEENPIIAFLETYQTGVCRHYAQAATLLYRSMGIPARYTVGFMDTVKAGETVSITDERGHAWVEVYVENVGWVKVEVTGNSSQIDLTVKPVDTRKQYKDGTEYTADQRVLISKISNGADMSQYILEAVVEGKRSELGITKTVITKLIIKNLSGKVVYDEEAGIGLKKFQITYDTGILQVYLSHLTFTNVPTHSSGKGYEKIYDGEALVGELSDILQTTGTIDTENGYSCVITPTASITNVGTTANLYTVKIYKDGEDVTDHYYISATYGTLTVKSRELTITAASAEEHYHPAKTLVCNDIVYDKNDIASTDHIDSFQVEGSQKNIGYSANVVRDVVIKNQAGEDVTSNYKITFIDGKLRIIP